MRVRMCESIANSGILYPWKSCPSLTFIIFLILSVDILSPKEERFSCSGRGFASAPGNTCFSSRPHMGCLEEMSLIDNQLH